MTFSALVVLSALVAACNDGREQPRTKGRPEGPPSGTTSSGKPTPPSSATTAPPPMSMQFARPVKGTAVLDRQDPRTSGPSCQVLRPCKRFAPLKPCEAGIEPIDASALASFLPPALGERVSVRGALGLALTSYAAVHCGQPVVGITNCCSSGSIGVFVGGVPNGVRLEGFGCYGDESRLCCPVPAFGQMVVATGRIMKETESTVLFHGGRFSLADATLCTEARPAGHAGASAHP